MPIFCPACIGMWVPEKVLLVPEVLARVRVWASLARRSDGCQGSVIDATSLLRADPGAGSASSSARIAVSSASWRSGKPARTRVGFGSTEQPAQ
jgi:hypothetical protein